MKHFQRRSHIPQPGFRQTATFSITMLVTPTTNSAFRKVCFTLHRLEHSSAPEPPERFPIGKPMELFLLPKSPRTSSSRGSHEKMSPGTNNLW
jgi:hypothetical protein